MTNEPNGVFERNVEALLRHAAQPVGDPAPARRDFLEAAASGAPARRGRLGKALAAASALVACGGILWMGYDEMVAPFRHRQPASQERRADPLTLTDPKPPEREADPAATELAEGGVAVSIKLPASAGPMEPLTVNGRARLPEDCVLQVSVYGSEEQLSAGRLVSVPLLLGGGPAAVKSGRFHSRPPAHGPAPYLIKVVLAEHNQTAAMRTLLQGKYPVREWTFPFAAWGNELLPQVAAALDELNDLAARTIELTGKFETKSGSDAEWSRWGKALTEEGQKFVARLELMEGLARTPTLLRAAFREILAVTRTLVGNARHFSWEGGKLQVKTYYDGGQRVKTHRGDVFEFETLRGYLREAPAVAGREAALWVVRDLRRAGRRAGLTDFLKDNAARPGLAPFVERLQIAEPGDFEAIEKEVRK